jgi:catechol 2,3-dioxygenase
MNVRAADSALAFRMPAETRLAGLTLRVRDLELVEGFYADLLGLRVTDRRDDGITLAPAQARFSLDLLSDPGAPVRPRPSLGLYHFALLLPDRPSLAAVVRRLLERRWALEGASDHGVSEALYLHDPEGNGIELYRDRPQETWPVAQGQVAMTTSPLDVDDLLAAAPASAPLHLEARLGHIHLHVADLGEGERFYAHTLGLTVTQRTYPGALFLAAGGYHHHVGLNTWARGRRAPDGATGLRRYAWVLPPRSAAPFEAHLRAVNARYHEADGVLALVDPAGIGVEVRVHSA